MNLIPVAVTFSYVEEEIPPRCRKPRPVRYNDGQMTAHFTVFQENNVDQHAPVAFIDNSKADDGFFAFGPLKYRWFKDQFWTCLPHNDMEPRSRITGKAVYELEAPFNEADFTLSFDCDYYSKTKQEQIDKVTRLEAMYFGIQKADKIEWWLPLQREPRYGIRTFGLGRNHGGTSLFFTCRDDFSEDCMFSLLQRDEAIRGVIRVADDRGDSDDVKHYSDPEYAAHRLRHLEILMPEVFLLNRDQVNRRDSATPKYGSGEISLSVSVSDWDDDWQRLAA